MRKASIDTTFASPTGSAVLVGGSVAFAPAADRAFGSGAGVPSFDFACAGLFVGAAARFGADPRVYLTTAKNFVGDDQGRVKEVVTVQIQWERNHKGQFVPREVPGTEQVRPVQLVLLAMGFLGPEQPLLDALGVERDPRSNVKAEYEKYASSLKGVFAAGDCRRGQSLVVWAFNEGRGAARECDRYLMGYTNLP